MANQEQTLVLLKPDALQRGLVGAIIARLEGHGFKMMAMRLLQMDLALAHRHYAIHERKPFFPGLVEFITSGPVVALVFQGKNVVEVIRKSMGATDPGEAAPGTIRGDLGLDIGRNLVHGSDSPEAAAQEIALFFGSGELVDWQRDLERWLTESE